jgi:hypothetical protein
MRKRAADLTRPDQRDFASGHHLLPELRSCFHPVHPTAALERA